VQFVRIHCALSPIAAVIAATHGRPRGCLLTGSNSSHTILRNGPFGKVPRRKAEGGMAMGYLPQLRTTFSSAIAAPLRKPDSGATRSST